MQWCESFIESFTRKVITYSSNCQSCESRRRLCKNFGEEYNHLEDDVLKDFLEGNHEFLSIKELRNVCLTFVHNLKTKESITKKDIYQFVFFVEDSFHRNELSNVFKDHLECFEIPHFLIVVTNFNETYVSVYDNVYDYYKNRDHGDPGSWYEFKRLYFKDWIRSFD
jgi:hypothetical protein